MFFSPGPFLALLAAFCFGISSVLIKRFTPDTPPVLMAGILYLGSGIGLMLFRAVRRERSLEILKRLSPKEKGKLFGAIVCGGILAPLALLFGLRVLPAFQVSALLNFETVATTLIAGLFFREAIGRSVLFGKAWILTGALMMTWTGTGFTFSPAALLVIASCFLWGLDNNLTCGLGSVPASLITGVKGLVAGAFNLLLAFCLGQFPESIAVTVNLFWIGIVCYGFSLLFLIGSFRKIGAARSVTYFTTGPFMGMLAAFLILGERPALVHWLAGLLMLIGVAVLFRERHEHTHDHGSMTHSHRHVHDEHHQHSHEGIDPSEPHEHLHEHKGITHSHRHSPDIHHRHEH